MGIDNPLASGDVSVDKVKIVGVDIGRGLLNRAPNMSAEVDEGIKLLQ